MQQSISPLSKYISKKFDSSFSPNIFSNKVMYIFNLGDPTDKYIGLAVVSVSNLHIRHE